MDTETREVLESIRTDIAGVRTELHTDVAGLRTEVRTEIAGLRAELHTDIDGLRTEVHTEIAGLRTEMRTEIAGLRVDMREGDETTRRHFDVVAESLRGIVCQRLLPGIDNGLVLACEILVSNTAIQNLIKEGKSTGLRNTMETGVTAVAS